MKNFRMLIPGMMLTLLFTLSCQRESMEKPIPVSSGGSATLSANQSRITANKSIPQATCNPNAYVINLESKTLVNGNWEWVWSVQNPNPGNGNNGTTQNLSHWGMQLASCVNMTSIVDAAYSSNGFTWTSFTPTNQTDPSQGCMTTPVLKFDFGTVGSTKSYYRLTVNQDFSVGFVPGYYKSGVNTGCCTFYFNGISGCGGPIEIEVVE